MTQGIHSSARSRTSRLARSAHGPVVRTAADVASPPEADRAWRLGYMAVSLLAIAAAAAIACGETASAELRFATAAVHATPLSADICSANGEPQSGAPTRSCANARDPGPDATGLC